MSRLRVDANYFNIFVITVSYSEIYPCPIRNRKITGLQYLVDSQSLGSSAGTKSGKGVIGSGLRVPRPAGDGRQRVAKERLALEIGCH